MCKGVAVMRRRSDSWLNATQILKVAGFDKPQRTRVLEREIQKGEHEKVQGGYGKYQGKLDISVPSHLTSSLSQAHGYRSSVASSSRGNTIAKPPFVLSLNSNPRQRVHLSPQNTSSPQLPSHDPLVGPQPQPLSQNPLLLLLSEPAPAVRLMQKTIQTRKFSPNQVQKMAL